METQAVAGKILWGSIGATSIVWVLLNSHGMLVSIHNTSSDRVMSSWCVYHEVETGTRENKQGKGGIVFSWGATARVC